MNDRVVICAGLLGALLLVAEAAAAPRRTTIATTLRKKPGEKEPVVKDVPAGTEVQVLEVQGRWLKVRVKNVEGFVTRTTVTEEDAPAPVVDSRAWSASRRPENTQVTDLFVEITAAGGALRSEPTPNAPPVAALTQGSRVAVLDATQRPGWIRARDDQGHEGWVARAQVNNGTAAVVVGASELERREPAGGGFVRRPAGRLAVRAELGVGYRSLGMDLTSNATGGLTNYLVDADAAALALELGATHRLAGRFFLAGDARLQLGTSSPGIDYPGPTSAAGKIPFKTVAVDAGARAGLRVRRVFDLAVGPGVHYDAFLPDNVDNAGMLPRERLAGVTLGARAEVLPARSPFSANARFDALLVGGRAQTPGLEDGASSTARGWWGGLTVRYLFTRRLALFAAYDFGRTTTTWTGMSVRQAGVTHTSRADTTQLAQLGISADL